MTWSREALNGLKSQEPRLRRCLDDSEIGSPNQRDEDLKVEESLITRI